MSTAAVICDMMGGFFALTQIQLDSYIAGAGFFIFWKDLNIAKFLLAFLTFSCQLFTLSQIFYYGHRY